MNQTISKRVFLELLEKQPYKTPVQVVIYSALEYYFNLKKNDESFGSFISYSIKERLRDKAIDENDIDGYLFNYNEAKRILIEELEGNFYPKNVQDVFFWALDLFGEFENTDESIIARQIVDNIQFEERRLMD